MEDDRIEFGLSGFGTSEKECLFLGTATVISRDGRQDVIQAVHCVRLFYFVYHLPYTPGGRRGGILGDCSYGIPTHHEHVSLSDWFSLSLVGAGYELDLW